MGDEIPGIVAMKVETIANPSSGRNFKPVTASFRLGEDSVRTDTLGHAKIKQLPPVDPLVAQDTTI
jgi:hypothetical protein